MSKRAVLYARVSTDEQADKGYSLPSQLDACRKYAERLGYAVVAEFQEDYTGAVPMYERPEGKKVEALLKRQEADAIIAYCVDRYYRDHIDLLVSVRQWLHSGIEVHACDIGKVESEYDIVLLIKGWQGSDERKKIIERTMRGRNGKAQSGKVVGSGRAPYGYQYEYVALKPGTRPIVIGLAILDAEAHVVRLIYIWYTEGDDDGKPLTEWAIAKKLSTMRITAPGATRRYKRKNSYDWTRATVHAILTNETYVGTWYYRKRMGKSGKEGVRPRNEQIAVPVPAIIDRELWELARARSEYNARMARRHAKRNYLLRGMVKSECGCEMVGSTVNGGQNYYYRRPRYKCDGQHCTATPVRGDLAEAAAWQYVLNLLTDPVEFERRLRLAQEAEERAEEPRRERLQTVIALLKDCEGEAASYAQALAKTNGGVVGRALELQAKSVEARYIALTEEREKLEAELADKQFTDANIQAALKFREDVIVGMNNATVEDKRKMFVRIKLQVITNHGKVRVHCALPNTP